jgi:hypothetical protein
MRIRAADRDHAFGIVDEGLDGAQKRIRLDERIASMEQKSGRARTG